MSWAPVDASSHVVEEHADGSVDARPIDPDQPDWTSSPVDPGLADRVRSSGEAHGVRAGVHDFFGGSIAVHLVHRQPRPVLVVPVDPSTAGSGLLWEEAP